MYVTTPPSEDVDVTSEVNSGGAVDVTCPFDSVNPIKTVVEAVASGDRVETGNWVAWLDVIVTICVEKNDLDVVPPIDACEVTVAGARLV